MSEITIQELKEAGLTRAASELEKKLEMKRKLTLAFERFRVVKPEAIDKFNEALKARTLKREGKKGVNLWEIHDKLCFIKLEEYGGAPPVEVLTRLKEVREMNLFDAFEVAKIESIKEYKDPIVFGRIDNCPLRFYVAQWDTDIRIEDLIAENEG